MQEVVSQNQPQNPYREFSLTVQAAANGVNRQRIFYATNYFRVLTLSAKTLSVNFYGTGDTTIVDAGIGIKLPDVLPYVDLINTGGADITVTVALGVVEVNDNRFVTSGVLTTTQNSGATLANAQVSVTNAATSISAASATKKRVIIKNPSTGTESVFLGNANTVTTANGFELVVGESVTLQTQSAVFGIHPTATENIHVLTESN